MGARGGSVKEIGRSSKNIYQGRIFTVTADEVELVNGRLAPRDVVHHPGGVSVVAVNAQNEVTLVTQFRYAQGEDVLEIVAGKREPGEDALVTARRELAEEAGLGARCWKHLTTSYPTPGYCTERIEIYLATDLYEHREALDEDEFLSVTQMPLQKAVQLVLDGTVRDAKTQTGLLLAAKELGLLQMREDNGNQA